MCIRDSLKSQYIVCQNPVLVKPLFAALHSIFRREGKQNPFHAGILLVAVKCSQPDYQQQTDAEIDDQESCLLYTSAHNTVLVDHKGQNRRASYVWEDSDIEKLSGMKWGIGDSCDWAEGCYDGAYGGMECWNRCV